MGMQGSNGVGSCVQTHAAIARAAAAATACHVPSVLAPGAQPAPARGARPPAPPANHAPGSGPAHGAGHPTNGAAPRSGARHACAPGTPAVAGGGPAALAARPTVAPDPAMLALAGLLGDATPPARGEGGLRQLTAQLSSLLASISSRIAALVPERAAADAAAPGSADQPAAPLLEPDPSLLVVRQPPPPPIGPILSLDPETGMIVDPLDGHGAGGDGSGGDAGPGEDPTFTLPSSWVPVASGVLARVRRRIGALADRIDALLAEVGMTRLQLLLLMLLGPAAVAFAIDVAVSIAQGR